MAKTCKIVVSVGAAKIADVLPPSSYPLSQQGWTDAIKHLKKGHHGADISLACGSGDYRRRNAIMIAECLDPQHPTHCKLGPLPYSSTQVLAKVQRPPKSAKREAHKVRRRR